MGISLGDNLKARLEELGVCSVTERITGVKEPSTFEYKAPDVAEVKDGVVCVYDSQAKAAYENFVLRHNSEKEVEAPVVDAAAATVVPEPCC